MNIYYNIFIYIYIYIMCIIYICIKIRLFLIVAHGAGVAGWAMSRRVWSSKMVNGGRWVGSAKTINGRCESIKLYCGNAFAMLPVIAELFYPRFFFFFFFFFEFRISEKAFYMQWSLSKPIFSWSEHFLNTMIMKWAKKLFTCNDH